jgi:hypothetical protein
MSNLNLAARERNNPGLSPIQENSYENPLTGTGIKVITVLFP